MALSQEIQAGLRRSAKPRESLSPNQGIRCGGPWADVGDMERLNPNDFKTAAELGHYVYGYLRAKTSKTAKAGTPYYVGIGSNPDRAYQRHFRGNAAGVKVPADRSLVVLMGVFPTRKAAGRREN